MQLCLQLEKWFIKTWEVRKIKLNVIGKYGGASDHFKMAKGITLTREELKSLRELLNEMDL